MSNTVKLPEPNRVYLVDIKFDDLPLATGVPAFLSEGGTWSSQLGGSGAWVPIGANQKFGFPGKGRLLDWEAAPADMQF